MIPEKQITSFNEYWKDVIQVYKLVSTPDGRLELYSGSIPLEWDVNLYELFGNPGLKYFQAQNWKEKWSIDKAHKWDWKDHMKECAGKTAKDTIAYIEDNIV